MFLALFIPPCFCLLSLVVAKFIIETNKLLQFENQETDALIQMLLSNFCWLV